MTPGRRTLIKPCVTFRPSPAESLQSLTFLNCECMVQGTPAAASDNSQGSGKGVVRELAGGCMCCSLSGPLGAAIAQLVRNAKPDRLIIEPSGLGHPAGLLDVLKVRQKRLGRAPVVAVVAVTGVGVAAHRSEVKH